MKHIQALCRSPLKTALTLLLLAAAVFLFLYNLSDYSVSHREYREAREKYEGVLTVEEQYPPEQKAPKWDFFLETDPTNPAETYGKVTYAEYHHESLHADTMEALSALPCVSRVERRYMTAGVSPEYERLDTDWSFIAYNARCILAGTVTKIQPALMSSTLAMVAPEAGPEGIQAVTLGDWEVLAGDPDWTLGLEHQKVEIWAVRDEYKGTYVRIGFNDFAHRHAFQSLDPDYFWSDLEQLEVGRRYVFILRNKRSDGYGDSPEDGDEEFHRFYMGDDTRKGWWPYVTDITDLPEGWLETEEFAPLRELIQVTNDDIHTFDVVYGDDMAAIRRVAEGRMVCDEGRFLTMADAGQPVCVMNSDLMETYGLHVGDQITLDLGNYLCEQYAPLGAVAATKGRYSTAFDRRTFTVIGAWRDLNEGKHSDRDRYWCYSVNSIFVPSAFLPDCVNADTYAPKPGELSFVVENAEDILPFVENSIPQVEEMGKPYAFSDGGWLQIADELMQAKSLSLVKLLIFSAAALFALILTVWLFIGRKKREYGILRALGMEKGKAGSRLVVPFLLLGILAATAGLIAARIVTARQLAAEHAPASFGLFLLGALGFLVLLALAAFIGLLLIRRKSILELVQEKQK